MYAKSLVSVQAAYETVPSAMLHQAERFPDEWPRTGAGFAKRLGSEYGQFVLSQTIQLAFLTIHKEDPRYRPMRAGNFFKRTGHAIKGVVIVSNTTGGQTLAVGQISGVVGSWAIASKVWEPRSEQSFGKVMEWGGVGLLTKAAVNFFHEFRH